VITCVSMHPWVYGSWLHMYIKLVHDNNNNNNNNNNNSKHINLSYENKPKAPKTNQK